MGYNNGVILLYLLSLNGNARKFEREFEVAVFRGTL